MPVAAWISEAKRRAAEAPGIVAPHLGMALDNDAVAGTW